MSVSYFKGDFCNIDGFKPSSRTIDAINEMNNVVKMSSLLEKVMMFVPSFQIFAGRDTYMSANLVATARNIKTYDWELFAQAVKGVDSIRRARLEQIAYSTADLSMGKEKEFWTCVYNSL
ncbi:hypothetical protein [Vibrio injensis]|uniref:hypothetical protein n=1 Tax=Vibrio injensis TaxID=1307414 RepID=UPI00278C28CE|nr:hypothetical protein [Vibrio injensis]